MELIKYAITAKNVSFGYANQSEEFLILKNVNLSVPKKSIYGLLGPSGCGKTTLLKTIIGFLKPSNGAVSVFGFKPGSSQSGTPGIGVGYMPQDICLPSLFTIREVFKYFGNIYFLDDKEIQKQMNYFLKLLNLNDQNAKIGNLSGGQMRRVSLAVTLFSYPRLLILDEPTVGVDPLLRETIWTFLKNLVQQKDITIIVTTHYIEEMNSAETVAFMRHGEILLEGNPKLVIRDNNCGSLEETFLELCTKQKHKKKQILSVIENNSVSSVLNETRNKLTVFEPLKSDRKQNRFLNEMRLTMIIIWKILTTYFRYVGPLMVFILPVPSLVSCMLCIGTTPRDTRMGLVVDEKPGAIKALNDTDEVPYLPEILLKHLKNKKINIVEYRSTKEALLDAKELKIFGYIHLMNNFSNAFYEREIFISENIDDSNETIEAGRIHVKMDGIKLLLFEAIERILFEAIQDFREEALKKVGYDPYLLKVPFEVEESMNELIETETISHYTRDSTIGIFIVMSFGFSITSAATSVLLDVNEDIYSRSFSAGLKPHHFLIAETLTQFLLCTLSTAISMFVLVFIFGVICKGSFMLAIINVLLVIFAAACMGVFLAVTIRNPYHCQLLVYAIFIEVMVLSAIISPWESYPYYMRTVLPLVPTSYQVSTMKDIFDYKSIDFVSRVLPAYISSICHSIFWSIASYIALRRTI